MTEDIEKIRPKFVARKCRSCGKGVGTFAFLLPTNPPIKGYWHPACFTKVKTISKKRKS